MAYTPSMAKVYLTDVTNKIASGYVQPTVIPSTSEGHPPGHIPNPMCASHVRCDAATLDQTET